MTVAQLIEELKKWPQDMPVATYNDINPENIDDPNWVKIKQYTWKHNNYPYNKPDFEYLNLE